MSMDLPTPKIFISYAWTDESHQEWVIAFAERLIGDGVDVVLDVWDFKEGHDKFAFMERMVSDKSVTKVLAICDRKYAEKADGRAGGVGTESQIISPEVYGRTDQEKFIPIVRERGDDGEELVPVYFKGKKYFDLSNEDTYQSNYESLVRSLHGRPERVKPSLGKPPAHLLAESSPSVRPAAKLERLKNAVDRNKPGTHAMLQEYLDVFLEGLEDFRLKADPKDVAHFDDAVVQSIADFLPWRDNFLDMIGFVSGYMGDATCIDKLTVFLERLAAFGNRRENGGDSRDATDNYRFIKHELFLSTVALLFKKRHFDFARALLDHEYHVARTLDGEEFRMEGIRAFNDDIMSLDVTRNDRLKLQRTSVVADLIKARATYRQLKFKDLVETDIVLFVRLFFGEQGTSRYWNPRLWPYLESSTGVELFLKASTDSGFASLQKVVGVTSKTDLSARFQAMIQTKTWADFTNRRWGIRFDDVLNIDRIIKAGS